MKNLFVLCVAGIFIAVRSPAQQQPQYTQYVVNNFIINPAISGIENYTDVKISHRHQWAGLRDAPVTTYFTIHKPINKTDYKTTATSFDMKGENPRGQNLAETYTAAAPHHGIGLKIINDRTGPLNRFSGYLSYAYHLGIGAATNIAGGFEAGFSDISIAANKLNADPQNPAVIDPAINSSGELNKIKPDFGAGIWLYGQDYFIGASAQQIIPQHIVFSNSQVKKYGGKLVPHLFITSGYRFFIDDDITALPSVMFKYVQPVPMQVDVNMKIQRKDVFWLGAGYRFSDGFNGMFGLNISNAFNISYSYDYTISALNTVSSGTHEIVLGFLLGNTYGDWCPKKLW